MFLSCSSVAAEFWFGFVSASFFRGLVKRVKAQSTRWSFARGGEGGWALQLSMDALKLAAGVSKNTHNFLSSREQHPKHNSENENSKHLANQRPVAADAAIVPGAVSVIETQNR